MLAAAPGHLLVALRQQVPSSQRPIPGLVPLSLHSLRVLHGQGVAPAGGLARADAAAVAQAGAAEHLGLPLVLVPAVDSRTLPPHALLGAAGDVLGMLGRVAGGVPLRHELRVRRCKARLCMRVCVGALTKACI